MASILIPVALAALGWMAWRLHRQAVLEDPRPVAPSEWAHQSEEHWVVDQVLRDIAEMTELASGGSPGDFRFQTSVQDASAHRYQVRVSGPGFSGSLETAITLQGDLWDPVNYIPFARSLSARLGLHPDLHPDQGADHVLKLLSKPDPIHLERAQRLLSRYLNQHPASADLHGRAAFLLSVLGMYNPPDYFSDNRGVLNRITAHLAMATALGQEGATPIAQVTDAARLLLVSRTAEAVSRLESMQGKDSLLLGPWMNSIYMLATSDARRAPDPTTLSWAEALAAFSARARTENSDMALAWIKAKNPPSLSYLHRVCFTHPYSVSLGHQLTREALDLERNDFREVAMLRGLHPGSEKEEIALLNEPAGGAYQPKSRRLEVIGSGIWARYFQASLLDVMARSVEFYENKYAEKSASADYFQGVERTYGELEQFPVLLKRYAAFHPERYQEAMRGVRALAREHPERISDCNFVNLCLPPPKQALPSGMPSYRSWISVPVPLGTLFNAGYRTFEMPEVKPYSRAQVRSWLETDPYNLWISAWYIRTWLPGRPGVSDVEFAYARTKEFAGQDYLAWMASVYPDTAPEKIPILRRSAERDPGDWFVLGRLLHLQGRDPEALEAYLTGHARCKDRVMTANAMGWPVLYLWQSGQGQKAEAIAEECADVHSALGIETMSRLREAQGRLDEAEDWLKKMNDRYGDHDVDLAAFYFRNASKSPRIKALSEKIYGGWSKNGLPVFDARREPPHPISGIQFDTYSERAARAGLDRNGIIVALDGYKIDNREQYYAIRSLSLDEHMSLVVFQNGGYQTVSTVQPHRRFGVDFKTFIGGAK